MAKTKSAFSTEFKGYKKEEVDEYIKILLEKNSDAVAETQAKNDEIEALKAEIAKANKSLAEKSQRLTAIEESFSKVQEEYSETKKENEEIKGQLDETLVQYDKLFKKYNKIHNDEERVARILLDTQKHAESVMNEATAEALNEKARLDKECEDTKRDILDIICDMRDLEIKAKESAAELVSIFRNQVDDFEKKLLEKIEVADNAAEELIVGKIQSAGLDEGLFSDVESNEDEAVVIDREENT